MSLPSKNDVRLQVPVQHACAASMYITASDPPYTPLRRDGRDEPRLVGIAKRGWLPRGESDSFEDSGAHAGIMYGRPDVGNIDTRAMRPSSSAHRGRRV